jgi:prepilin-type N-terminal cleavage/methylation domain-containing protein
MSPSPSTRTAGRPRAGFSLIEILIVMVMIGVLVGIALPRMARTINRDRVLRSATVVQGMMDEATQFATRLRVPVTVTLSSGTITIANRSTGEVLRRRSFGNQQDLRATVSFNPVAGVTVFPTGRANADLVVTLTNEGGYTTTVTRTATGIVRRQ